MKSRKMHRPEHLAYKRAHFMGVKRNVDIEKLYAIGFAIIYAREYQRVQTYITLPDALDKVVYAIGILLLAIYIVNKIRSQALTRNLALGVLTLIGLESYLFSGESAPFTLILVLIATAEKDDIKASLRIWLLNAIILFCITLIIFIFHVVFNINDGIKVFYRSYYDHTPRYSLGYTHPNACASVLVMIYAVYLMIYGDKSKRRSMVKCLSLFGAVGVISLFVTNSRTEVIVLILITIGWLAVDQVKKKLSIIKLITAGAPILLTTSVWLLSGPMFSYAIEGLFTNRVRLWHSFYINCGITVFGQPFKETTYISSNGWEYYNGTLDSAYAYLILVCGLLVSFALVIIWIRTIISKSTTAEFTILLLAISVFAFIETTAVWITVCGPILILSNGIKMMKVKESIRHKDFAHGNRD